MTVLIDSKDARTRVPKAWGYEEIITNNSKYCGKVLVMSPGWQSSKHCHPIKEETMLCIDGVGVVEVWGDPQEEPAYVMLRGSEGTSIHLPPNTYHRFSTSLGEPMILVEFSTPHSDEDVERLEVSSELPRIECA